MSRKKSETAGPGHNSGETPVVLTEDQRCALLVQGVKKIETYQEQLESIKANIRNVRRALKSDGFDRFEVDYALRLRRVDDTEELDRRRREARIARWLNHAIGTQADLFADEEIVDRTPSVDKAFSEGKLAGMEGESCNPPSHMGQEQRQEWIKGWGQGQSLIAVEGFAPLSDAAEESNDETEAA